MKKVLVLILMAFVAQGSLLLGRYDNLNNYFNDSKITRKCLDQSESYLLNTPCERLDEGLILFRRQFEWDLKIKKLRNVKITEDIFLDLKDKYLDRMKQRSDRHAEEIYHVLYHGQGLDRTPEEKLEMQKEIEAYQEALNKAADEAFADIKLKLKK